MGQIYDNNKVTAQISVSRSFTSSLANLNSDLADILLSGKSDYFYDDLTKTRSYLQQIEKTTPEIADLDLDIEFAKLLAIYKSDATKEEKFAKLNGIIKQNIITPIFNNREWLPVTAQDQAELQNIYYSDPVKEGILSPSALKLIEKKPGDYEALKLDMRKKPQLPKNWHKNRTDIEVGQEILKHYIKNAQGDLDEMIDILNDGEQKVRKVLQFSDMSKVIVDYKGNQVSLVDQIHRRVVQIAARMHDCGILAVEARNKLYRLEELPAKYIYNPLTIEQEGSPEGVAAKQAVFWKQFMADQEKMKQRYDMLKNRANKLSQAFRKFFSVWSVVYAGDATELSLEKPSTQFQLTRYGQEVNKYLAVADDLYEALDDLYYELQFTNDMLDGILAETDIFEERSVAAGRIALSNKKKVNAKSLDYEEQKQALLNNLRRVVGDLLITYGKIAKWDEHRAVELLDAAHDGDKRRLFDRLIKTQQKVSGVRKFMEYFDERIMNINKAIQFLEANDKKDGDEIFKLNQIFSKYQPIKIAGDDPFDYVYGDYAAKHTKTSNYIYENEQYMPLLAEFDDKMTNIDNKFDEFKGILPQITVMQPNDIKAVIQKVIDFKNFYLYDFSKQFTNVSKLLYKKYKSFS